MNFFDRQDKVRTRSRVFFTAFVPAVILAVAALYFAVTFCLVVVFNFTQFVVESFEDRPKRSSSSYYDRYSRSDRAGREYGLNLLPADLYGSPANILAPRPIVIVGGGVVCFILLVAMCKHYAIRKGGGAYVLKLLGGRELRDPDSPAEKRLVNIVAEMALASGLPRPRVFVLDRESSINAVTAGLDHQDAVIAVTGGALAHLTREELQGVVAHEFAHILNDDYQLNLIMSGWLYGLLFFTIIGRGLIAVAESNEFLWEFNLTGLIGLVLVANGVLLRTAGSLGHMSAAIIEAAFCRTREHLADAFAVQFTRDPRGLTNALRKIGGQPGRVGFRNGQALTMKSFFIVDPASRRRGGFLSSHPSLASRIRALDPHWDRTFIPVDPQAIPKEEVGDPSPPLNPAERRLQDQILALPPGWTRAMMMALVAKNRTEGRPGSDYGELSGQSLAAARRLLARLPAELGQALTDPAQVRALVCAVFLDADPATQARQLDLIGQAHGRVTADRAGDLAVQMGHGHKMPVLELVNPTLKGWSSTDRRQLSQTVRALIEADGRVTFLEIAGERILNKSLGHLPRLHYHPGLYQQAGIPEPFDSDARMILCCLARQGTKDEAQARAAFEAGLAHLPGPEDPLHIRSLFPKSDDLSAICGHLGSRDIALRLDRLKLGPRKVKFGLIKAALITMLHDNQVTVEEYDFLWALAAALDIPLPWLAAADAS